MSTLFKSTLESVLKEGCESEKRTFEIGLQKPMWTRQYQDLRVFTFDKNSGEYLRCYDFVAIINLESLGIGLALIGTKKQRKKKGKQEEK